MFCVLRARWRLLQLTAPSASKYRRQWTRPGKTTAQPIAALLLYVSRHRLAATRFIACIRSAPFLSFISWSLLDEEPKRSMPCTYLYHFLRCCVPGNGTRYARKKGTSYVHTAIRLRVLYFHSARLNSLISNYLVIVLIVISRTNN